MCNNDDTLIKNRINLPVAVLSGIIELDTVKRKRNNE